MSKCKKKKSKGTAGWSNFLITNLVFVGGVERNLVNFCVAATEFRDVANGQLNTLQQG